MKEPRDLGPYLDPPLGEADARRHLQAGRRRLERHRRRRALAGVVALGLAGTAAAALLPRLRPPATDGRAAVERPAEAPAIRPGLAPAPRRLPGVPAAGEALPAVRARPADAFVDGVGLHVRLWYEAYQGRSYPLARRLLRELGVRHVHDVSQTVPARLRELGETGIRVHVLVQEGGDPEALARALGPALASVQIDWRFGDEWKQGLLDAAWAERLRRFAEATHRRVRASPLLAGVPLVGPSVRAPYETELVGDLGAFADLGALTYWPAPGPPDTGQLEPQLEAQRRVFPGKELVISQGGYTTAPLALTRVSEAVQARYLLRLHLETFDRGVVRTFANQLLDFARDPATADAGIGVVRMNGAPKPAFGALRALLGALADPGPPFDAGTLAFAVDSGEPDLRHVLLRRRDGTFVLALWLARPSEEEPVRRPATLRLEAPARRVRTLHPHGDAAPREVVGVAELALEASDAVTLIEIQP